MKLTVLGSGTCVPRLARSPSGYLLEAGGRAILLDGGTGTVRRLLESGSSPGAIDIHLLSHTHPDHCADLVPLIFACRWGMEPRRSAPLALFGPTGIGAFVKGLASVYGEWVTSPGFPFEVREATGRRVVLGDVTVTAFEVDHSVAAVAWRIEHRGKVFCYSGDSDVCDGLIKAAHNADLFLCECSMPEERKVEGHLTPRGVAEVASAAGARSVLLTHMYPPADRPETLEEVQAGFERIVIIAEDGMEIEV